MHYFTYSQFHITLPVSSLQMQWISVRFYEMGDIIKIILSDRWIETWGGRGGVHFLVFVWQGKLA